MANNRLKRHKRIRKKVSGTTSRPRLSVYRSNKYIQIQLVDDVLNMTILGMSTSNLDLKGKNKTDQAKELGIQFANKLSEAKKKFDGIVFDRGGYRYHGRVKAVAEGLREAGLVF